jgi:hypothetical protein
MMIGSLLGMNAGDRLGKVAFLSGFVLAPHGGRKPASNRYQDNLLIRMKTLESVVYSPGTSCGVGCNKAARVCYAWKTRIAVWPGER